MGTWGALTAVLDTGDDYLDSDFAVEAIAAAAIIAAHLPGGAAITSSYAPNFLLEGGRIHVSRDLPPLAVQALDRIVGEDSEWCALWEESGSYPAALAELQRVRTTLETAANGR